MNSWEDSYRKHHYTSRWYHPGEAAHCRDVVNLLHKLDVLRFDRLTEYRSMTSSPTGRTWQLELRLTRTR